MRKNWTIPLVIVLGTITFVALLVGTIYGATLFLRQGEGTPMEGAFALVIIVAATYALLKFLAAHSRVIWDWWMPKLPRPIAAIFRGIASGFRFLGKFLGLVDDDDDLVEA